MPSSLAIQFARDMFPDASMLIFDYLKLGSVTCWNEEKILTTKIFSKIIAIRNPELLPFQLAGLFIGLSGTLLFVNTKQVSKSWFWGMLFFACMNAVSIACHNLTERLSRAWNLARIADIIFTGSSSVSLAFVALQNVPHIYHFITFLIISFYGLVGDYHNKMFPFTAELIYICMMVFAFSSLAPRIFIMTKSLFAITVALMGVFMILMGPIADTAACRLGIAYGAVHLVFFGSDLAMLGLIAIALDTKSIKSKID